MQYMLNIVEQFDGTLQHRLPDADDPAEVSGGYTSVGQLNGTLHQRKHKRFNPITI